MSERNANRPGYKKTREGWIPEEWEVRSLFELCSIRGEYGASKASSAFSEQLPRYIRITDITAEGYLDPEEKCSVDLDDEEFKKYELKKNDTLFARSGATVGKTYTHTNEQKNLAFAGYLIRFRPDPEKLDSRFLHHFTHSSRYWYWVKSTSHAGAQPNINATEYGSLPIPVPSISEQEEISEILGIWDQAIEQTQQLIDAKQRLKKGLMQQLLTGRMRFPGFGPPVDKVGELPEGWEEKRIEDIGSLYNGLTGKTKLDFGKGKPFIPYTNIMNNSAIDPNNFGYVKITSSEKQNRVKYGDALFTASSETAKEISMSSVVLTDVDECYLNSFCFGLRFKDLDNLLPEYARYLFRSSKLRKSLLPLAQGFTRYNISKTSFLKIKLTLPKNEEQNKIAAILEITESDINNLQKKINYYHKVKKGLLQVLLSGEVRV